VAIYSSIMSYQDQSGGYPPPRDQQESQYPPPPGEEDERARAYHQRMPSATGPITLPTISPYDPQYGQPPNGYVPDPRVYPQDPYRPQPGPYRDDRGYQQDYGRGGAQHMAFSQSAPRQRTAIACRYCRRRKVSNFALGGFAFWTSGFLRKTPKTTCLSRSLYLQCDRFAAQVLIRIPRDAVQIASVSSKNAFSPRSPLKLKPLSLLTLSTPT
jgi:hypothetical protein